MSDAHENSKFSGTCPSCHQAYEGSNIERLKALVRDVMDSHWMPDAWSARARRALKDEPEPT